MSYSRVIVCWCVVCLCSVSKTSGTISKERKKTRTNCIDTFTHFFFPFIHCGRLFISLQKRSNLFSLFVSCVLIWSIARGNDVRYGMLMGKHRSDVLES